MPGHSIRAPPKPILHELFGNLGGYGKGAGDSSKALGEDYGTLGRWERGASR